MSIWISMKGDKDKLKAGSLRIFYEVMVGCSRAEIEGLQALFLRLDEVDRIRPNGFNYSALIFPRICSAISARIDNELFNPYFNWYSVKGSGMTMSDMIQNIINNEETIKQTILQIRHEHKKERLSYGLTEEEWEGYYEFIWGSVIEKVRIFFDEELEELIKKYQEIIGD